MPKNTLQNLSKRERQIMDIVVKLGQATVYDILDQMTNPPSYNAIRVTMTILEKKGYLLHKSEGNRYIYFPSQQPEKLRLTALEHLLSTLFQGSAKEMVSSLLKLPGAKLNEETLEEITRMIEDAKKEG